MTLLTWALLLSSQLSTPPTISAVPVLPGETKPSYRAHASPACSDWYAARAGKDVDSRLRTGIYRNWVLGYITGFNIVGPDPTGNLLGTASLDEVYAAIDNYCARNRSHSVVDAMRPITAAIVGRREVPATTGPTSEAKRRATVVASTTCRDWVEGSGNAFIRLAHIVVLDGYITAYNQWGPDALGDAIGADDRTLIEKATETWCGEHPSGLLIGVVRPLIDKVATERAAGRLPPGGMRPQDDFSQGVSIKR